MPLKYGHAGIACGGVGDAGGAMEHARAKLMELAIAPWVDGYTREFIQNVLLEDLDYLSAISARRIQKLLEEDEFRQQHPNATWHG